MDKEKISKELERLKFESTYNRAKGDRFTDNIRELMRQKRILKKLKKLGDKIENTDQG